MSALLVAFMIITLSETAPHSIAQARPTGTIVSGVITQSVTWNTAGSPYTIDGSLTVPNGLTLTVEPRGGHGQLYGRLVINGTLNAIGTQPTHSFTSGADSAPTQWDALVVSGGTAHIAYAEVRYGGAGYGCSHSYYSPMCVQITGTLSLDHMYFHHNNPLTLFSAGLSRPSRQRCRKINLSITHSLFQRTAPQYRYHYPVFLDGGIRS
jgi:hypothetical protein